MRLNKRICFILALCALIILSVLAYIIFYKSPDMITEGETLASNEPPTCLPRSEVIGYFKQVALGTEFGNSAPVVRKWETPMNVYIKNAEKHPALSTELTQIIEDIHSIEHHPEINLVTDKLDANYSIFLGSHIDFAALEPGAKPYLEDNWGLYSIYWDDGVIYGGDMYVDTMRANLTEQKHLLREELTQSLGLGNDSYDYPDSIFQQEWTKVTSYSNIDKELINLLYSPEVKIGMNADTVESTLNTIIESNNCDRN